MYCELRSDSLLTLRSLGINSTQPMTDRVVIRKGLRTPDTAPNGDSQLVRGAGQPTAAGLAAKPPGSLDLNSLGNKK